MFKIGKIKQANKETVTISFVKQEETLFKKGKKLSRNLFNTLSFDIEADEYSLSFDLNCRIEKLLDFHVDKTEDFNKYIHGGETFLSINRSTQLGIITDSKITRYLKNRFVIFMTFVTSSGDYTGSAEISFNLDDYLNKKG